MLPSGAVPPNPAELLGSPAMRRLLADLRLSYDYVVVDTTPVLPVADASVLSRLVDGMVVVANAGRVRRRQLAQSEKDLTQVSARILGVVLNGVRRDEESYTYRAGTSPAVGADESRAPRRSAGSTGRMTGDAAGRARGRLASVLVVCTGNICRSPAAELLLRAGLGQGAGIRVASAGIRAMVGASVAPQMAGRLRDRGIDPAGFAARQLDPAEVRGADVVLTMTAEQRAAVVSRTPAAVRRTFTLREFADLARLSDLDPGGGPADRLSALVAAAPLARARRAAQVAQDDIDDPYGRQDEVFERVLAEIETAVGALLDALTMAALSRCVTCRRPGDLRTSPASGRIHAVG